jgi:hypothetical protein
MEKTTVDCDSDKQEGEKLYFESMKHLTTLNTASILLLVTFLEKLFQHPRWKALVAVTLGSLAVSTLCSVSSMLQSANHIKYSGQVAGLEVKIKDFVYYSSLVTFLIGILSLVLFGFRNLF